MLKKNYDISSRAYLENRVSGGVPVLKITHRDKISKIEGKVFKIKFLKPPLNLK